jgi:hypothetical protein
LIVYAVIDERSPNHPLGDFIEVFVHREDAGARQFPRCVAIPAT